MPAHPHEPGQAGSSDDARPQPTEPPSAARRLGRRIGRPKKSDVVSGMVTGLFSIPEGMAYASIAGFNPVAGLYAGVVPAIVGSLTARTVLMVTTLTSAIALTSQSVLSGVGLDPKDPANVATLTVMVGIAMLLMGFLRLGAVMSFVSNAVMTGFSTGIALQIVTGVLEDATGYDPRGHNRLYQLGDWLVHIGSWELAATLVAVATVVVWALARRVERLVPVALLVAMVVVSVVVVLASIDVRQVSDIASIPAALPGLSLPDLSVAPSLVGGAFAVALVGLAQAASIAPSMPNPDGSRSDANADFRSQGWANVAGGFFQALPSGGSMSRTGVAVDAGAQTRWAGVVSGVFLALVVVLLGGVAELIPMPVIGGLILVVGGELIWGKRREIRLVLRTSPLSSAAMVLTFLATTALPLQQAIVLGAVLSLLLYCVQAARQSRLLLLTRDGEGRWHASPDVPPTLTSGEVTIVDYAGTSFFAGLPTIERALPRGDDAHGAALVLVLRTLPDIPSSAMVDLLHRTAKTLQAQGNRLYLAGISPAMYALLQRTGTVDELGEDAVIEATDEVLGGMQQALDAAERWAREHT
ncbi:SulP family inorganic anion transporter [Cellulosimicrobium arenosum]|uniref:SulP family inorganic anion transporter n=1 Tax=Cellulosimicrobium arenosum TaxID=2708133 RepID=A0A927PCN9_9MICO|nr:SulP family inorganic anion transporter [Cellulosimicrobium arenosum]MBD8079561.1 SulP family inorganic anion transporter [Cellulosimicrobium arenosum]